jgi:hypothetical protein
MRIKNPKSEYRNSKQIKNPNIQNSKQNSLIRCDQILLFWLFGFWSFEFVLDFGFRASDFLL